MKDSLFNSKKAITDDARALIAKRNALVEEYWRTITAADSEKDPERQTTLNNTANTLLAQINENYPDKLIAELLETIKKLDIKETGTSKISGATPYKL